jgi:hypothetical protein
MKNFLLLEEKKTLFRSGIAVAIAYRGNAIRWVKSKMFGIHHTQVYMVSPYLCNPPLILKIFTVCILTLFVFSQRYGNFAR